MVCRIPRGVSSVAWEVFGDARTFNNIFNCCWVSEYFKDVLWGFSLLHGSRQGEWERAFEKREIGTPRGGRGRDGGERECGRLNWYGHQ